MLFVITAVDRDNSRDLRLATRPAHFDYVQRTGAVRLGGPFLDARGDMLGSLIIIEAPDLAAAREWQQNDPYVKAGLFAKSELRAWKATANYCNAEL
ncbi:MAG TPA: YciI family protein [Rhizomicrobium sp.]|nr:YciI family protein [Rhizomicrobium sp.]